MAGETLMVRLPKCKTSGMLFELRTVLRNDLNASIHSIQFICQQSGLLDDLALVKATFKRNVSDCLPRIISLKCGLRLPVILCPGDPWDEILQSTLITKSHFFVVDKNLRSCTCPFLGLPYTLWSRILSDLTFEDFILFAQACPCSYHLVWNHCQNKTTIELGKSSSCGWFEARFGELHRLHCLPLIYMHNPHVITRFVVCRSFSGVCIILRQAIKWLHHLKEFVYHALGDTGRMECDLDFSCNHFLDTLEFFENNWDDKIWKRLFSTCPNLKVLSVRNTYFSLSNFCSILPPSLERLSLVTYSSFQATMSFKQLVNLKHLSFFVKDLRARSYDNEVIKAFSTMQLPSLTSLEVQLQNRRIVNSFLGIFRQTNLEELELPCFISSDTMETIISNNPHLKSFVCGTPPYELDLSRLQSLHSLTLISPQPKKIKFTGNNIFLPKTVRRLDISATSISTDVLIDIVRRLDCLEEFIILDTEILGMNMFYKINDIMRVRNHRLTMTINETQYRQRELKNLQLPYVEIIKKRQEHVHEYSYSSDDPDIYDDSENSDY